jgi:hypothetical protein
LVVRVKLSVPTVATVPIAAGGEPPFGGVRFPEMPSGGAGCDWFDPLSVAAPAIAVTPAVKPMAIPVAEAMRNALRRLDLVV